MYFVSLTQRKIKENIAREFFPEIFREIKTLEKEIENEIYLPRVSELQEELRYKRKKFDTLVREYLKK
ncbi:MAG: hypothetical protein CR971_00910 [candidate division SR1 bacterium]|nr:MAG: hypothetical protein CR971_00910 [candidate division SR1 bacterium]